MSSRSQPVHSLCTFEFLGAAEGQELCLGLTMRHLDREELEPVSGAVFLRESEVVPLPPFVEQLALVLVV